MTSDQLGSLIQQAKVQDFRAIARLLTLLEREGPSCLQRVPELLRPAQTAFRLGITGPPGAGKSTLIGQLIGAFRARKMKVGVLAVDPSSPFSKGAVLGDRIRYSEHFNDSGVFIRSVGSRGSLGGLSASSYLMVRAFDLAGFDIVLIETVGVGQTELEIMNVADYVGVVLVPESGDSIQGMKAGLLEIADLFIVNKSDRPGAESFKKELEAAIHLDPSKADGDLTTQVLATTATSGAGVQELVEVVAQFQKKGQWQAVRAELKRLQAEGKALLREQAEREIDARVGEMKSVMDFAALFLPRSGADKDPGSKS